MRIAVDSLPLHSATERGADWNAVVPATATSRSIWITISISGVSKVSKAVVALVAVLRHGAQSELLLHRDYIRSR